MIFPMKNEDPATENHILKAYDVLMDLAEICQYKVDVYAAMKLMLLHVSQTKVRYLIKLRKIFGLASYIPYVSFFYQIH